MPRRRFTPEQIRRMRQEAEVELAKDEAVPAVGKKLGVTTNTCYRRGKKNGGLRVERAKRLKELARENAPAREDRGRWEMACLLAKRHHARVSPAERRAACQSIPTIGDEFSTPHEA